jgi:hypothetical protein
MNALRDFLEAIKQIAPCANVSISIHPYVEEHKLGDLRTALELTRDFGIADPKMKELSGGSLYLKEYSVEGMADLTVFFDCPKPSQDEKPEELVEAQA